MRPQDAFQKTNIGRRQGITVVLREMAVVTAAAKGERASSLHVC